MNWRLILSLSSLGVVISATSVLGWVTGFEEILWTAAAIFFAFQIAAKVPNHPVFHGAVTGLISGLASPLVKFLFLPQYLANNPDSTLIQLPVTAKATFFLAITHYMGVLGAAVVSFLTWLVLRTTHIRATS